MSVDNASKPYIQSKPCQNLCQSIPFDTWLFIFMWNGYGISWYTILCHRVLVEIPLFVWEQFE